jgi:hypothetical protein
LRLSTDLLIAKLPPSHWSLWWWLQHLIFYLMQYGDAYYELGRLSSLGGFFGSGDKRIMRPTTGSHSIFDSLD